MPALSQLHHKPSLDVEGFLTRHVQIIRPAIRNKSLSGSGLHRVVRFCSVTGDIREQVLLLSCWPPTNCKYCVKTDCTIVLYRQYSSTVLIFILHFPFLINRKWVIRWRTETHSNDNYTYIYHVIHIRCIVLLSFYFGIHFCSSHIVWIVLWMTQTMFFLFFCKANTIHFCVKLFSELHHQTTC